MTAPAPVVTHMSHELLDPSGRPVTPTVGTPMKIVKTEIVLLASSDYEGVTFQQWVTRQTVSV